jgi:hypothetical protein
MFEKVSIFIAGILMILVGIRIFFFRVFDTLKFGLVNMGPYHSVIGVMFVVVGLVFVFYELNLMTRHRGKGRPPRER